MNYLSILLVEDLQHKAQLLTAVCSMLENGRYSTPVCREPGCALAIVLRQLEFHTSTTLRHASNYATSDTNVQVNNLTY